MTPDLKQRAIKAFGPILEGAKWREDEVRLNTAPEEKGGYSEKLTEAIEVLEEFKNATEN